MVFLLVYRENPGLLVRMVRRSRIEYSGAIYHVINWENYRSYIFETDGARKSFLECLERQLRSDRKGAPWKVAVARLLRERYLAPNRWIAERLLMGRVSTVQGAVSRFRTNGGPVEKFWRKLKKHERLVWCFSAL